MLLIYPPLLLPSVDWIGSTLLGFSLAIVGRLTNGRGHPGDIGTAPDNRQRATLDRRPFLRECLPELDQPGFPRLNDSVI
jgi:hypothetical protein